MSSQKLCLVRTLLLLTLLGTLTVLLTQCSDDPVAPDPAETIVIESGDQQYSKRGTALPTPLVVRVRTTQNKVPEEAYVVFKVLAGDGSLSKTTVRCNQRGQASTEYTLGPELGTNIINATLQENTSRNVQFQETSANFFCPEQEDTFRVKYGPARGELFLTTHKSTLYPVSGSSGVVQVDALFNRTTDRFAELPPVNIFESRIYDAAFSARGDFYVARLSLDSEILKIDPSGNVTQFVRLDSNLPEPDPFVEIATNPSGLLVGCDVMGPFIVGCGSEITRFDEALFTNGGVNNDALAVDPRRQSDDPLGEDVYFIYKPDSTLFRLSLDSLTVERDLERVTVTPHLTADEARYARGMACDGRDGTVFILVDSDNTKEIISVTPDGAKEVLVDFFVALGPGDAAGMQRDLAIHGSSLYTLDTLNDDVLVYSLAEESLTRRFKDMPVTVRTTLSIRAEDGSLTGGERVGLAILK
jgi:hypothetical protein